MLGLDFGVAAVRSGEVAAGYTSVHKAQVSSPAQSAPGRPQIGESLWRGWGPQQTGCMLGQVYGKPPTMQHIWFAGPQTCTPVSLAQDIGWSVGQT